jgi:transposase
VAAIAQFIEHPPGHTAYNFVADRLNTHQSEALVRYVAQWCGIEEDLGKKGRHGILQSMASRADFLARAEKAIVFHYTPKHASWMNQIEIWFGILARKVIRRGSVRLQT